MVDTVAQPQAKEWHSTYFVLMKKFAMESINLSQNMPNYKQYEAASAYILSEINRNAAQISNDTEMYQSALTETTASIKASIDDPKNKNLKQALTEEFKPYETKATALIGQRTDLANRVKNYIAEKARILSEVSTKMAEGGSRKEIMSMLNDLVQKGWDLRSQINNLNKVEQALQVSLDTINNKIRPAGKPAPTSVAPAERQKPE